MFGCGMGCDMTPKERIDKRAREMHKPILAEVRRLEAEVTMLEMWILIARAHGISEADKRMKENLNWTTP